MLAYIDPNLFGLPVQAMAPWLAACMGAVITAILFSWRSVRWVLQCAGRGMRRMPSGVWVTLLGICTLVGYSVFHAAFTASSSPTNPIHTTVAPATRSSSMAPQHSQDKILILGMDGLDPDVLQAMMEAGDLPHFAALAKQGLYRKLNTILPAESPVVWSCFSTGLSPCGHGIFDFIHRDPRNYTVDLSLTQTAPGGVGYVNPRGGETFWQKLSQADIPVRVLFAPCSFPPEHVQGLLLSGMGVPDLKGNMGRYILISSDPTWAERKLAGDLVGIAPALGNTLPATSRKEDESFRRCVFDLPGPRLAGGGLWSSRPKQLTLPVELIESPGRQAITLHVDGQTIPLGVGQWSPWVTLHFERRASGSIQGICRFYLTSLEPDLNLYVTPIQFDPEDPVFPITHPPEAAGELVKSVGLFSTLGMPLDTKAYEDGALDAAGFLGMAEWLVAENERLLQHEMDGWKHGLLFCYFNTPDPVQHMFWEDFLKKRLAEQGVSSLPKPIRNIYRRMDQVLGRAMDPRKQDSRDPFDAGDTQIIVLSDHGFADFRRSVDVNRILMDLGYLHLKKGHDTSEAMFAAVDWSTTRVYACGFTSIYLNRKGRERDGIVTDDQTPGIMQELRERLTAYTDPETHEHPFARVEARCPTGASAYASRAPDLVIGFQSGYRSGWQTAVGAIGKEALANNTKKWRGDHIMDPVQVPGILLMQHAPKDGVQSLTHIQNVGDYVLNWFGTSAETPTSATAGVTGASR